MKKKNAKDRRDESRAMKSKDRGMDSQFFGMISEDSSCVANLPQEVVYKPYPRQRYFDAYELDDTIRGLDDTRHEDLRTMDRYASDTKY
jgi:hypothetical protein